MTRFLIVSNTPNAPTGYGMQCAMLCLRLQADGHDVAVASTWGQQGEIGSWRGIRVYPSGWAEVSADVIHTHALHWFDNDPRGGYIIVLTDVWAIKGPIIDILAHEFNVIAWTPVDHKPVSPMTVEWLRRTGARPLSMSKFGQAELVAAGMDPTYIPLATDTSVYKPTPFLEVAGQRVDARTYFEVPHDAFVVGMVAMNKDPADRKGFNEAFRGFAEFRKSHPNAVMLVHNEPHGIQGGIDLLDIVAQAGLPEGAVVWTNQYAYRLGFSREMMAALYTACDVLLAPSRGEGFGVPLIEAQACGTPVIVSDYTSQPELVGVGWIVDGQEEYDPPHRSNYFRAFIADVAASLAEAYEMLDGDAEGYAARAIAFAADYDADLIFETCWRPFLASLQPQVEAKPKLERVDVIVPFLRDANHDRLVGSLLDGDARLLVGEYETAGSPPGRSYAENVNEAFAKSDADWIVVVGDDCEFLPGWLDAIRDLSDRYDVIGTNDSEPGRTRNPDVAAGRHADHFAIRRSYIEELGSSLDGPGVVMPTAYRHWYTDKEVVGLARARGVYGHAHEARIVHHHPGYDGREDLRESDPVYMAAVDGAEQDRITFMQRAPLIENHRVSR